LAIVVASPELLKAVPATPEQLRMANGLAAFVEHAALQEGAAPEPEPEPVPVQPEPTADAATQLVLPL
jgi:hypothetical protein